MNRHSNFQAVLQHSTRTTRFSLHDSTRTRWLCEDDSMRHHNYTRMTRWDTVDSTRTTQRGDDSTRMTRWGWLDEDDSTRRWLDEDDSTRQDVSRLLDESGLLTTERDICFANILLETIFIFPIILNVLFLLKLWSFIQFLFGCFISLINPLFWILKFHFIFIYTIIICIS